MNNLAPILLFTYKRVITLKKTVDALKRNDLAIESDLFVFSDGPKDQKEEKEIYAVRGFLRTIKGFKNVSIVESETNKGLASSIISGVTEIMKFSDRVIVLEDDLLTTPNFLVFMNKALKEYENDEKIFSVSGYSFNLNNGDTVPTKTYFLNRGWSWGWGTWKKNWDNIDWQVKDYPDFKRNKLRKKEFARGGSDLNGMLKKQMEGRLDSWAIRWFYHQFKVKGLTLYPEYSKVYNNGFDDLATHTRGSNRRYLPKLDENFNQNVSFPVSKEVDWEYQELFLNKMGVKARIRSKIETVIHSIFKST